MKKVTSLARRFAAAFDRPKFFRIILALFVLQAAWIALSGRYPMAFDEDFHFGIIRLYAHHLSPFWAGQPENADKFGAVARDPSYLYQYLMSFPYRLIAVFTGNQTVQVLILRGLNIGLFAGGLALYRRLLLKTGASRAMVHFCLLIFVLIPIVPLLAAQINYDNLLLPLTALTFLMAVNFSASLTKRKHLDVMALMSLLALCLLTSLVKYAFLPLFIVVFGYVLARLWQHYGSFMAAGQNFLAAWKRVSLRVQACLLIAVAVSVGLFAQRYGVNLVRYHAPIPDCGQVLSVEACREYGPWIRDYNLKVTNAGGPRSIRSFTLDWFYGMWFRTFFAVDGPATDFQTRSPLMLPGISAVVFIVLGLAALAFAARRVWSRYNAPVLWLFTAGTLLYALALWLDDYKAYLRTGHPVAINGRYLLPVALFGILICVMAVNELLKRKLVYRTALASALIVCFLWGGGALTYILRSNDSWYWPNPAAVRINHIVQRTLGPITPGYQNLIEFWPREF